MSNIWPSVTKEAPCPICGKEDWCTVGDRAVKCMRIVSPNPVKGSDGWYHFFDESKPKPAYVPPRKNIAPLIGATALMTKWRQATTFAQFQLVAGQLGVLPEALIGLGAAWAPAHNAWAFPMKDGLGNVIGIRLRNESGDKWAVTGSRQGLFIPEPCVHTQPVAYLPEGPTDTAAFLSIGLYAIGRPSCNAGVDQLREALKALGIYRVVIVADNDEMKKVGTKEAMPGIDGAVRLKKELKLSSVIWVPTSPHKDVRSFVRGGGTKALIESDIKNRIWTKI